MCLKLVIGCDIMANKKVIKKGSTKKKTNKTRSNKKRVNNNSNKKVIAKTNNTKLNKNSKKTVTNSKEKSKINTPKTINKSSKKNKKSIQKDSKIKTKKLNRVTNDVKTKLINYKKRVFIKNALDKDEKAKRKEELKSVKNKKNYRLFTFVFILTILIVVLLILFTNDKNNEIKLENINISSYMDLYKKEETSYIYITMNNCTYCELLDPYIERLQSDYKIKFKVLNISELNEEEMEELTNSNSVFNDNWKAPVLISIKDGKEISNITGYKEYGVLKRFVEYSNNPNDSVPFIKISIEKYLNLLNSKELSIIYIGRPNSNGCEVFVPILNKVTSEKNLKVYYLNTDTLDTTEKWDKLNNSNEIFKGIWFTPTILIVKNKEIIDYKMESMDEETLLYFFGRNGL